MGKKRINPKKHVVSFRVSYAELARLEAIAQRREVPLSEIARERVLGTAVGV